MSIVTVTLVTGPPCAGKTTWVRQHAHPGDLIVCHDTYAQRAGSPRRHDHAPHHSAHARRAWDHAVTQLAAAPDPDRHAWVIRCAPTAAERRDLADRIHADHVVVLLPPRDVALRRAAHDHRARRTFGVIHGWYRSHQPAPGDHVIAGGTP